VWTGRKHPDIQVEGVEVEGADACASLFGVART